MSFIIRNEKLIAATRENLKSGTLVLFGEQTCREAPNANRERNLVNAKNGVISNEKKWDEEFRNSKIDYATKINDGEYLI